MGAGTSAACTELALSEARYTRTYVSPAAARDAGARPRRIDMDPLSGGRPDVRRRPIEGVDSSSNKAFVKRSSPGVWGVDTSESPSSKNAWKSRWPSGAANELL